MDHVVCGDFRLMAFWCTMWLKFRWKHPQCYSLESLGYWVVTEHCVLDFSTCIKTWIQTYLVGSWSWPACIRISVRVHIIRSWFRRFRYYPSKRLYTVTTPYLESRYKPCDGNNRQNYDKTRGGYSAWDTHGPSNSILQQSEVRSIDLLQVTSQSDQPAEVEPLIYLKRYCTLSEQFYQTQFRVQPPYEYFLVFLILIHMLRQHENRLDWGKVGF